MFKFSVGQGGFRKVWEKMAAESFSLKVKVMAVPVEKEMRHDSFPQSKGKLS